MAIKWPELAIGIGTSIITYRMLRTAFENVGSSVSRLKEARCPGGDDKCKVVPAGNQIEQRAKYIAEMVWNSSLDPEIKRLAMATLNKKCDGEWCTPPRDHLAEVRALTGAVYDQDEDLWDALEGHFAWVKENIAYRKDHAYVDQFPSAKRTREYGGEDCDGQTIIVDAMNMVSGFPVGMRIYQTTNSNDWDHIAALVQVPPHSGKWHVMDASVDKVREGGKVKAIYPGWGAPKSMITKYVDFQILPGGKIKKIGSGP